ncbi:hypothetical protein N0V93_002691 [Gnomoniopsis smithogilvyi]|uniref:Uncharacterized protein n=1 Tax=Gnomoniopsis smithogilvyi TaxID=1191159 RepID=A0A9W9CZE7_9PEZI|nr:hypothetical protein N0V93_002691 [Gnomoniopsis smithogilvyi]
MAATSQKRHPLSWLTDAGYFQMPLWYPLHFLTTQMRPLPYPESDYSKKTCIVTGANVGLGKEAARHLCRLGAEKVVLACRDLEKGREAQVDIEASTQRKDVIDVWALDLGSFQSVIDFCQRADTELERVDVVIENAGVAIGTYVEVDGGYESSIGVNVVSTFLMAFSLLPKLRKTAMRFNTEPRLVVVSSDAHMFAKFNERTEKEIFESFKGKHSMSEDRYNTSKLLPIWIVRELAARMPTNDAVIVNCVNPGFCRTNLFRHAAFPLSYIVKFTLGCLGRDAEMGSRTLMAAAAADRQSHGKYMDSCIVRDPSNLVLSQEGTQLQKRIYQELVGVLEDIRQGISQNVNK